jgi:hypothetical protein
VYQLWNVIFRVDGNLFEFQSIAMDSSFEINKKKLFFHLTVHSVHPALLLFKIIMLGGDHTMKGEQSIVHLLWNELARGFVGF